MSSADLDHIRALLVAQTADPEPQARSLLGRLFVSASEPARPSAKPPRFAPPADPALPPTERAGDAEAEPELLLEHVCRPPLDIETASPLPPPSPRGEFGRRADLSPEPELVLDQPATTARRLQLLDPASGQPVGEMILHPNEPPMRVISTVLREEVPYFPEDYLDPEQHPGEPQPLRPWLKALRQSGLIKPAPAQPVPAQGVRAEKTDAAASARRAPAGRTKHRRDARDAKPSPHTLGRDLLEALALTLGREQETLADRLLGVARNHAFGEAIAESAAA